MAEMLTATLKTVYPVDVPLPCIFSNQVQVTGLGDSLYLDFCTIAPESKIAEVKVRVVVTLEQARKIHGVLAEILTALETQAKGASASGTKNPAV